MRFKVDENLPPFIAARLRNAGFDAMTVAEQSVSGMKDERLAPLCAKEDRILVTLDLGFGDIRAYPPGTSPGFIVFRLDGQDRSDGRLEDRPCRKLSLERPADLDERVDEWVRPGVAKVIATAGCV